jgi:hypothetical protein
MTMTDVQNYLAEHPGGALPDDIARAFVVERINLMKHLRNLAARGIVVQVGGSKHQTRAVWRLSENQTDSTRTKRASLRAPFTGFGGAANLALMSAACVDRLRAGLAPHWTKDMGSEVLA